MKRSINKKSLDQRIKGQIVSASDNICFVISPIGKEGTKIHTDFKEVLDYVIKPAVNNSGYQLEVIRADSIKRAGSFIKDILEYLLNSYVVIADLTGKNANVFYELGVRHSLSPRTILIAQSLDDIPSDLRDYRTIIYDTSAKGAKEFQSQLAKYLGEIRTEPTRSDNPVLDRLPSILERGRIELERENIELKKQIETILKKRAGAPKFEKEESVRTRVERILDLIGAQDRSLTVDGGDFHDRTGKQTKVYKLPTGQGNFRLHFMRERDSISKRASVAAAISVEQFQELFSYSGGVGDSKNSILGVVYFSIIEGDVDYVRELADVRILIEDCSKDQNMPCKFIIVTNKDLRNIKSKISKIFDKMKSFIKADKRKLFKIEIWDKIGLLRKEKELGIKMDI